MPASDEDPARYEGLIDELRRAYDGGVERRDQMPKAQWKLEERSAFLERLRGVGKMRLLKIGAGTGQDSLFFQGAGLNVVAADLSSEMVARCRGKGIDAYVMDFLSLDFPACSFDAVYALNCLLHVPNVDIPVVLKAIRDLLAPSGLFFMGVYGGEAHEGIADEDWHDPPRFFSSRTDDEIQRFAREQFEIVDFHVVEPESFHFQSLTLRRRD